MLFGAFHGTHETSDLIFHYFDIFFSVDEYEWDMDEIHDMHKNHEHGIKNDRKHHEEMTREHFENGLRKIYFNYLTRRNNTRL